MIVGPTGGGEQLYQDLLFGSPIDHQHWGTQLNLALFGATGLDMGDLFFRFGVTRALIALLQWPILLRNDARPSLYAMLLWVAVNSLTEAALIKFLNFAEHLGLPAVYQYWLFAPLLKGLITGGVLLWLLHSHLAARH